ncbi:hypothetical protein LTS18_012577 [Coniosporium uncinatum]|uniref:Uncharacterized protein n=1 Tax=Coniosporium uncinatum TaxID=93489 RepID=A0ACC3DJC3_9PEZI|nr:hypothetical protein LTS18_012577 [Coniosporium uncinatum]
MQFTLTSFLLSLLAILTMAAAVQAPQKSVIISYPEGTPMNVMEQAKEYIKEAGGAITHEYNIIMGFAATGPAAAFDMVTALGTKYNMEIEEDQVVSAYDGSSTGGMGIN